MTERTNPLPTTSSTGSDAAIALHTILSLPDPAAVGELLRAATFPSAPDREWDLGCYTTFDVRDDATEWDRNARVAYWEHYWRSRDGRRDGDIGYDSEEAQECADMGQGCSYQLGPYRVDCVWYWDGDGTLTFRVSGGEGELVCWVENTDCKKTHGWEHVE